MNRTKVNRIAVIGLLVAIATIGVIPTFAQDTVSHLITVSANSVRVRFGPDTGYAILGYVHQGERYALLGRDTTGFWAQIEYRGMTGWVNWNFIQETDMLKTQPITEVIGGRVQPDILHIRLTPRYDADLLGNLPRGEIVDLIGRDDGSEWVKVQTNSGMTGWVAQQYLNIGSEAYFLRIPLLSRVPGVGSNFNPQ
ncbi:MAG: SH3 domain-containing protein [Chloroflexota bacterium]